MSKPVKIIAISAGALALALLAAQMFVGNRASAQRLVCCSNCKNVATTLKLHAEHIDLDAPDPIGQLVQAGYLLPEAYHCPAGNMPYRVNMKALREWVENQVVDSRVVIAYEDPENHKGIGGSVTYGDGHNEFLAAADLRREVAGIE